MLLKAIRTGLGSLIILADRVSRPTPQKRSVEAQAEVQNRLTGHALYQLRACPFCVKTRRAIHRLNIELPLRDVGKDSEARAELESGGGRVKVPCLRIDTEGNSRWMYESDDIIRYLEEQVA